MRSMHIYVSGTVQGVGYRSYAYDRAHELGKANIQSAEFPQIWLDG